MSRRVKPEIFMVAKTEIDHEGLRLFLQSEGIPNWQTDAGTAAEALIEIMGRLCYRSFVPGLNANVTKVRKSNADYLANIQKQAHGAVCEHASVSFIFKNVSRVFTHELVRHRAGTAISQESLRYVRLTDIDYWLPSVLADDPVVSADVAEIVDFLEQKQRGWAEYFGLDEPGINFGIKKVVTSALRRLAPIGLSTRIGWTANFRALPNIIDLRTSPHAEEEIRLVFGEVAKKLAREFPTFFQWEANLDASGLCHYWLPTGKL